MFIELSQQAIHKKEEENKNQYGEAYIAYAPEQLKFEPGESTGYSDKVLRIPTASFMTVEFCQPQPDGYHLGTYTPCALPSYLKTTAYKGTVDDDELHRHDYYEVILVLEGFRVMQVENQIVTLQQNDICIFDMQCAHLDLRSRSEGIAVYSCFTKPQIDSFLIQNLRQSKVRSFFLTERSHGGSYLHMKLSEDWKNNAARQLEGIFQELERNEVGVNRITQVYLLRLLNLIAGSGARDIHTFEKRQKGTKLFHAVEKYIDKNLTSISLDALSKQFHYQEDYYNRLIKKNTGMSYSEYLRKKRVARAKHLLINTALPIHQIAEQVGYSTHAYFYRIFQEDTGMTPKQYRDNRK